MNTGRCSYPLGPAPFGIFTILLCTVLASCSLSPAPGPLTNAVSLREGLGLNENEGWIVLSRPNSLWTVGTVIEKRPGREAKDLGTLASLGCFSEEAWLVVPGTGPEVQYGRTIDYGLSVSATLGLPQIELAKAGLSFGSDGATPTHKAVVVLNKVSEQRVDTLKVEEFLENNFRSMSPACQRNLMDASRFIVDKILVIEDGELSVVEGAGAKVDLSLPKYQFLQEAASKAGYSVTKDGSLKVSKGTPITFAIREADFGTTLARMGIQRRGSSDSGLPPCSANRVRRCGISPGILLL